MTTALRLYHQLPSWARSLVASAKGYQLRRQRYGPATEPESEEALGREQWEPSRWKAWQTERLQRTLRHAATSVPYYREYWGGSPDGGGPAEQLRNWPVLRKETVRERPEAFVADGFDRHDLLEEHTSGTTGTPLKLWATREAIRSWYALAEARWRRWYGISRADRWAIIGGQRVVPFGRTRPPFWVWNLGLSQLYMSAAHAREDLLPHYLDAIRRYRIVYLYGYASSLYWLALAASSSGIRPALKLVETNAEPLYPYQRDAIERAFGCPVRETYGQAEMVCAMSECERRSLHLWPEVGIAEAVDDAGQPVPAGEEGRLIATGFLNEAMPLIRYEVGDLVRLRDPGATCPCGRGLPMAEKVVGRKDDVIRTKDGRRIALLDIIFGPELHLKEAQIVQETLERIRVRVVPTAGWEEADVAAIRAALRERMGPVEVSVETVPEIERTWAGKFRVMVSKLEDAETQRRAL